MFILCQKMYYKSASEVAKQCYDWRSSSTLLHGYHQSSLCTSVLSCHAHFYSHLLTYPHERHPVSTDCMQMAGVIEKLHWSVSWNWMHSSIPCNVSHVVSSIILWIDSSNQLLAYRYAQIFLGQTKWEASNPPPILHTSNILGVSFVAASLVLEF